MAYNTNGSNHAITFEAHMGKLENEGLRAQYRDGVEPKRGNIQPFRHSPPLIQILGLATWIITGVAPWEFAGTGRDTAPEWGAEGTPAP